MGRIAFCVGLFVLASSVLRSQSLEEDPLIHYYFSEEEVNELQSVVHFFDEYVTRDCDQSVPACLGTFADALADSLMATSEIPDIFDDTWLTSLLDSLSPRLFGEIWHYGSQQKEISSDSIARYWEMGYRVNGRYLKYLSASSYITDTTLKHYIEPAEASGALSPSMVASLLLNHSWYDLNDERNRLLFAIHCITLDSKTIPKVNQNVLQITNTTSDLVFVELRAYPAIGYKNNKVGAFNARLSPQQTFILNFDGLFLSKANGEISAASQFFEQEGFEVVAYKPTSDETIISGDNPKDTLLTQSFTVQELINQSPVVTIP